MECLVEESLLECLVFLESLEHTLHTVSLLWEGRHGSYTINRHLNTVPALMGVFPVPALVMKTLALVQSLEHTLHTVSLLWEGRHGAYTINRHFNTVAVSACVMVV